MDKGLSIVNNLKSLRAFRFVFYSVLVGLLSAGCSSSANKTVISEIGREHVWLRYEVEKTNGTEKKVPQGYDHPAEFTVEQVEALLLEIEKQDYEFFEWQKPESLFSEKERGKLAPLLVEAFQKATPDTWIDFLVTGVRDSAFSDYPTFTAGICFIQNGQLNFVFSTVELPYEIGNAIQYEDAARGIFKLKQLRLHPIPEKNIEKPGVIEGDEWLNKEHDNWLIVDIQSFRNRFATAQVEAQSTEPYKYKKDPVTRMKMLKELHDLNMISDEEFEKKRKEILKQL